ncbi:MAG: 6-carboxytetrahydropterin synthase [Sedimentisphaerales bacterium]|nr:6-carboxytetrahydropterin synthase [Sedimentisphaerales bacterium]
MHELARQVRFSVNPFLPEQSEGANSFASMPSGEGLAIFFELSVELAGEIDHATGFVVNVAEIDSKVRQHAVPVFISKVKENFCMAEHISLFTVTEILHLSWNQLEGIFVPARLNKLSLKLNPFRKIMICSEDSDMVFFSEKFEFAATHKLWNNDFTDVQNRKIFGKCANPTGHGHNYVVEVTVKMPVSGKDFSIGDFEKIVDSELISLIDHKNLNLDIEYFKSVIATVENIAVFAWEKLVKKFPASAKGGLHCVTVWETDKTSCSYYGC